jgi:hypothetical protein
MREPWQPFFCGPILAACCLACLTRVDWTLKIRCRKRPLPHRPNSPGSAILNTADSRCPAVPHELCSRARLPCTPVVADSGRAAHGAALSFQRNGSASASSATYSNCAGGGSTLDRNEVPLRESYGTGVAMPQSHTFDPARLVLQQPKCPKCGLPMWLARIEPDKPDHDRRTFECPSCEHSHTEVVKYK